MADLAATMPDAQLEALDAFLGGSNETAEDRVTAINVWLQKRVDETLWNMARKTAMDAVSDPTV
ncbi:MAG: hypothetical protein CL489_03090 [Acidobacteria bacterium]|nr:hypothetical protein [Acidobacteriota bacterium]|tara:strand:- start:36 stop:227 length:192 start_codon:yes stop_codon:yes gene_type:complete